ncbi:MAG TPA: hypothetical protein VFB06_33075 [Streptosporangiaceae bacterium]|nr:hypothetical protein [Streptosporangiaceae bacterium]
MRSFSRRAVYILGVAFAIAALALPASAASAATGSAIQSAVVPFSATGCAPDGYPEVLVQQCTQVIGGGLKVDAISGKSINSSDAALNNLHVEIYGPDGTIKNCPQFNLPAYKTGPQCNWNNPVPQYDVTPGNYCSRTWLYNGRDYVIMGIFCIDVHA